MAKSENTSAPDLEADLRHGLTRSFTSLAIKIAAAGLTYVMFVALSRTMSDLDYGLFAFGFSLATILSTGASLGQQTAILRFWPEDTGRGDHEGARTDIRAGWALTLISGSTISFALFLSIFLYGLLCGDLASQTHIMAAACLIQPLGAAEYASSALRAQGSVSTALAARDIAWRLILPLGMVLLFAAGIKLAGWQALLVTALLLATVLLMQAVLARRRGYYSGVGLKGLSDYWRTRGRASLWFLSGTIVNSAALNVDIVLIGLFVAAESAGLYFNAFRTAGILTLFMFATTLVIAPMVARAYHAGDIRRTQAISTFCAWSGFLFSLGVFVVYVFFGELILSLFGETYAEGALILIILSIGLLFEAATGATRVVMNMTGHERQYVQIFGTIIGIGLVMQIVVIPVFGVLAAACVNAGTRIIAQIAIAWWTRRHIGIDPTLFGVFRMIGRQSGSGTAPSASHS